MPRSNSTLAERKPTARSRVTNGRDLLPGIDGRSPVARRYRDICASLASDMGGAAMMSEARSQLCRRFAALSVIAETMEAQLARVEPIDLGEYALVSSTLVRIASRLGIERRSRKLVPTIAEYIEANKAPS
jgi:hypothetical protein